MAKKIDKFLDIKLKLYRVDNGFIVYFNNEIYACNTAMEPVSEMIRRLTSDYIMNNNEMYLTGTDEF